MSKKYQPVVALAVVQLYVVEEKRALSFGGVSNASYMAEFAHTPLAFSCPVLRRAAASMPSVVIALAEPSSRLAARTAYFMAMLIDRA